MVWECWRSKSSGNAAAGLYVSNGADGIIDETRSALHCGHPTQDDWWVCKERELVLDQGQVARVISKGESGGLESNLNRFREFRPLCRRRAESNV